MRPELEAMLTALNARRTGCRFTEKHMSDITEGARLASSLLPQPSHIPAPSTLCMTALGSVSVCLCLLRKSSLLPPSRESPCWRWW